MNIMHEVGETAGAVWNLLHQSGPQTLAQLKKKLNNRSEVTNFAVGWLAREEKLDILQEGKTFQVRLRD